MNSLPDFDYYEPDTLNETFALLQERGKEAHVLAGGTDLLVQMKLREIKPVPRHLINIKKVPGLKYLRLEGQEGMHLGALSTIQEIKTFVPMRVRYPGMVQAVSVLSTPQIRNLATIGGNLCNASPSADTAPVLISLSASVKVISEGKERIVPLEEFFLGPGRTVLEKGEILADIYLPDPEPNSTSVYLKHGKRLSDMAIVGLALMMRLDGDKCVDAKIALASAAPTPMRAKKAESLMIGEEINGDLIEEVAKTVSEEARFRNSFRGAAASKKENAHRLAKMAIKQAVEQIKFGVN